MKYKHLVGELKPDIIMKNALEGGDLFIWIRQNRIEFVFSEWDDYRDNYSFIKIENNKIYYMHSDDGDSWSEWEHEEGDLITQSQIIDAIYDHVNDMSKILSE